MSIFRELFIDPPPMSMIVVGCLAIAGLVVGYVIDRIESRR